MLWEIAKSLTALSPVKTALDQAHRQARQFLETGGAASGRNADRAGQRDFPLPRDIDAVELAAAIDEKLPGGSGSQSGRSGDALRSIGDDAGGGLVVAAEVVRRLGDGDYDRGVGHLERMITDMRARRVLARSRQDLRTKDGN